MTFALGSSAHIVLLRPQIPAVLFLLFSWTDSTICVSWTEVVIYMRW